MIQPTLRRKWQGTGMYKICRDASYSGGEKTLHEDIADFFIGRFQAQLEVLAEEVAKIKNPYTKDHDTDVLIGIRNGALGEAISLIRTFSKELK